MRRLLLLLSLTVTLNAFPDNAVEVMTTSANGQLLLKTQLFDIGSTFGTANCTITLNADKKYQTMDGFGFALTYSACYNLMKMKAKNRHDLLVKTFSPSDGFGTNYVRMSIACSDFSSECYTYCEKKGPANNLLVNFKLHDDELTYVIPILKEVLAINPDIKIMAAPWTAPRWMKQKSITDASTWNHYAGGVLNPKYYEAYAQYFVKFVQVMKTYGINIYAVTPQNEPLNAGNCASTYIGAKQEGEFVKHLAHAFHNAGITTRIYVFDHNYNYDNKPGEDNYPIQIYNALESSMPGYDLVKGCAWHDYGGSYTEMEDIQKKAPNMEQIFTETSIGSWNDGRNLRRHLVNDFNNLILHFINRFGRATIVWNFMLDLNYGPYTQAAGSCTTCMGAIDIDQRNYNTLYYNSHYYLICHAAKVIKEGAYRIGNSISADQDGLLYSTFLNPGNNYSVLLSNNSNNDYIIGVKSNKNAPVTQVSVPAKSVVSVFLGHGVQ
ncbi:MAG: glucosylceramidase [Bacteroidaceae bacterium]|nr:glucosylceramidase [Bacteroidaceae bacterium]